MKKMLIVLGLLFFGIKSPCFAYHVVVSTPVNHHPPHVVRNMPPPPPPVLVVPHRHHAVSGVTVVKYNPAGGVIGTYDMYGRRLVHRNGISIGLYL